MSAANIPGTFVPVPLHTITPKIQTMLDYCGLKALESNHVDAISYTPAEDEVVYYTKLDDLDRGLFPDLLTNVEEIWIVQRGGSCGRA